MSNLYFPNHSISIYRRRQRGNSDRYAMSATFTAYNADIQPADRERQEMVEGRFGAVFTAFVEASTDIKEGDQVVTEDGKRYSVRGVNKWEDAGMLDHLELLMVSMDG